MKKSTELVQYKKVESTPFTIAGIERKESEKKDYYILLGKHRVSEKFETEEEAEEDAKSVSWDKIFCVVYVLAKEIIDNNETITKQIQG